MRPSLLAPLLRVAAPGQPQSWQRLLLHALLVVVCLNASLIWSLHQATHFAHEQAAAGLAPQLPADDEDAPAHEACGPCQIFAHLISPALQPLAGLYPVGSDLAPSEDFPPPPLLARSGLPLSRAPPAAS